MDMLPVLIIVKFLYSFNFFPDDNKTNYKFLPF